ncbi:MAG: hypothetical protein GXY52_01700 [Chloroflexi bacterium]|mgnify:CR=1 FL=1|nr:hypothetical protein [Chloroflexota bacterium]
MNNTLIALFEKLQSFSPQSTAILIVITAVILMLTSDVRRAVVALLVQYTLLAILIGPRVYGPLTILRIGIGIAICAILLVTIRHARVYAASTLAAQRSSLAVILYRILTLVFSALAVYAVWQANLLHLSPADGLVTYALILSGIFLAATGNEPLRLGIGILMAISGFATATVLLEQGLLVIGLWGVIELLSALAIAASIESWADAQQKASVR